MQGGEAYLSGLGREKFKGERNLACLFGILELLGNVHDGEVTGRAVLGEGKDGQEVEMDLERGFQSGRREDGCRLTT